MNSSGSVSLSDVVVAVSAGFPAGDVFVGVSPAAWFGSDIGVSERGV